MKDKTVYTVKETFGEQIGFGSSVIVFEHEADAIQTAEAIYRQLLEDAKEEGQTLTATRRKGKKREGFLLEIYIEGLVEIRVDRKVIR